ncbi:hypothetical protein HII36_43180 [Nonomuraea sp. NN258]|uniref:hypothetical protein n=1 Tax=Nonomuraea antri TaxID=2730852 RepID=UPI00156A4C7E|nr:hypothetical protein [Nonomuraea antri]NRQ38582.1 hypothetical protein [Nonomuraea antri]
MPRRTDGWDDPQAAPGSHGLAGDAGWDDRRGARGPQAEPFETTGAFAAPGNPSGGFTPPPAGPSGHSGPFPATGGQPEPFETTGAFAAPGPHSDPFATPGPHSDPFATPGPHSDPFATPGPHSDPFATPGPHSDPFAASGPQSDPFAAPGGRSNPHSNPHSDPFAAQPPRDSGPFAAQQAGPFETTGAFARPPDWDALDPRNQPEPRASAFDPAGTGPTAAYRMPGGPDQTAAFNPGGFDQTAAFDPMGRPMGDPMGGPMGTGPMGAQHGPRDDDQAPFDAPGTGPKSFYAGPPEPGDIKVAGEPTSPTWAEAETGFLRSGWTPDEDLDEPGSRRRGRGRGRRKPPSDGDVFDAPPAGRGRVALLSVAAVVVVLGGTVAGVKFISSSGEPETCATSNCTAVQSAPVSSAPPSDPVEEEPEEEPIETAADEEAEPSDTPTPKTTQAVRTPRRPTTPSPTPTKSKTKTPAQPTEEPEPTPEESVSESPTEEETALDPDTNAGGVPTAPATTAAPTATATTQSAPSGGSVNLQQQVVRQGVTRYTARVNVLNDSGETLAAPTLSLPVEGEVLNVNGAEWTQDGDLLIIDLPEKLASGESVEITYTATGEPADPENCGLVGGECAVS